MSSSFLTDFANVYRQGYDGKRRLYKCCGKRYSQGMANGVQTNRTQAKPMAKPMAKRAAENLSAELARQGYSDREAANRLGLTNVYVSRRANGSVEMSVSDLELFADFLQVPISRLLENRDVPLKAVELPGLDSNQEPIGSQLAPVSRLSDHQSKPRDPKPRGAAAGEVIALRLAK